VKIAFIIIAIILALVGLGFLVERFLLED